MKRAVAWMLGLIGLSLALGWATRHVDPAQVIDKLNTLKRMGLAGDAAFVAFYALCVILLVPGTLPNLAAGVIYGLAKGSLLVTLGASLGSAVAFLIGRFALRDYVRARVLSTERFRNLDQASRTRGLRLVALLRLSPLMPYNILNYALGVTQIRLRHYLAGGLAIIPSVFLYVGLGAVAGRVVLSEAADLSQTSGLHWTLQALALLAGLVLTVWFGHIAKRELDDAAPRENAEPAQGQPLAPGTARRPHDLPRSLLGAS